MFEKIRLKLQNIIFKIRLSLSGNDIFYVNGPETLPPPLTKEEESECIERIIKGDKTGREQLITHNLRLVVYIAKKFENSGVGIEDLISIGTIGLIKAVNTFSPEKNIKLATYASRCIENEILMYLRKAANRKVELSLDEPLNVDRDGNELVLSDVLSDDENNVAYDIELKDEKSILLKMVEGLNDREKMIVRLRFGILGEVEHTQKEVADMMGISQSYISRLEKRIIQRLKRELESYNL